MASTSMAIATANAEAFRLLDLPTELRFLFYDQYIFKNARILYKNTARYTRRLPRFKFLPEQPLSLNLLKTCKQIRAEAIPVLQKHGVILATEPIDCNFLVWPTVPIFELSQLWQGLITTVELPHGVVRFQGWSLLVGLERMHYTSKTYVWHFPETKRPSDIKELGRLARRLYLSNMWIDHSMDAPLGHMIEDHTRRAVVKAWVINTQRHVSEGWEIEIDIEAIFRVVSTCRARFTKNPFDEFSLIGVGLTKAGKTAMKRDWKLSTEAWTIERLE